MKIIRFNGGRIGLVQDDRVFDLTEVVNEDSTEWPPVGMSRVIRDFDRLRPLITAYVAQAESVALRAVRLETPIPWPNKLMAYPVNYHDHAKEMASKGLASIQGYFLKANSSICGPADSIVLPALSGREVHHECEIALIIGKEGRQIPVECALDHVFGYACLLDMTIRGKEERVFRKSYDSFTPIGPWIVTADEIADPTDIAMQLSVNDEVRQTANTRDLIVDIPSMVSIASSASTLYPGDVIASGTPAGVGPVSAGDVVTIEVTGVGQMTIPVVQGNFGANPVFEAPYAFVRAG